NAALPASWLGWMHGDIRREIAVGLKGVVISGMREEFVRRASTITDANRNYMPVDTITMNRLSINQLPEYHAFNKFVQTTGEFEHHAGLYNSLSLPHNDQRLAKIIGYLYGMNIENDVQDMIESDYKLMQSVDAENVQLDGLAPQFREKSNQMNQSLQRKLFFESPVAGNITGFQNTYTTVLQSPDADNVYDTFLSMATSLEHLQSGLQNKESEWISGDGFIVDVTTKKLLESIAASKLLGGGVRSMMENGFDTNFTLMRGNLQRARIGMRYGSDDSVHVVQINPESKHWALTPAVENTYKSLIDWKKQPFVVKSSSNQRLTTLASQMGETQRIVWNGALLKTLPQTLESYSKYLTEGINKFPAELQIPAENVVRRGIHRTIGDIVVRACDMQPATANRTEQEITVEVQSFADAIPNLGLALRQLSASDDGSGSACATIVGKQIAGVLGSMYRWVIDRQPYSVSLNESKLSLWKPQQSIREVAFDIREADQLQDYLESQRKPIEEWTKQYASPLLSFYNQNGLSSTARLTPTGENDVREWNSIARGIEGYAAKAPNNSLGKLEDFITSLGNITQTNVEEMQKMVISRNAAGKDDFFLRKIKDIANDIRKSIAMNSAPRFREDYKRIYQTVSDMRQYFPFGESEIDADPERVKTYFTKMNNELTYAKLWLSMGGEVSLGHDRFLRELFAAREFFKPITYSGENNSGTYTVTLTYRTNQAKEQNATTVYARASSQGASGSQVDKMLVTPGDQAQFTWRPGDDFRFEIHWAKDGGVMPVANTEKYDIVNERTVVFKRAGNWSLLRFISEFMNGRNNGKIQIALPVVTSGKGSSSSSDQNLLLYVDVDIAPRVRDENLAFPLLVGQAPVPE
ncbi:MAG: hypothetical protein JNL32_14225, partial [Candidatus Kapabacteria bacterium]|nr:hypothetical protein [Candidatus Kapabacteria bacterium]